MHAVIKVGKRVTGRIAPLPLLGAVAEKPNDRWKIDFLGNISLNHYNFKPADRETTFGTSSDAKSFRVYFDGEEKDKFETYLGALQAVYRHNKALLGAVAEILALVDYAIREIIALYLSSSKAYMTLNAGLRFSYNDFNREFLCSPRVNLSINPMESFRPE